MKVCLTAGLLALGLAGCGSSNWGFPYRTTIQQGNWITSEQVSKLEVGMTRDQVRFLLGTPTLQDAFHADRWDYPYYNQPGYGKDELRKFTVWFENDRLVRWAGDEQPDRQPFQKLDTGREAIAPKDAAAPASANPAVAPSGDAGTQAPAAPEASPAAPGTGPALPGASAPAPGAATPDTGATIPAADAAVPAAAAPDATSTSPGGQP